jgi:diadenosine tetraphosphate (Ap4A) HIT family hydrolase
MDNKNQVCNYCEKGENLNSVLLKIIELPYSTAYLLKNQQHRGRCIVAYKDHKTEYFHLNAEENTGFFADVSLTAQALYNLFHPSKINYATYGDLFPHVHVHVVPKYEGGTHWGMPFGEVPNKFLSDSEYQELVNRIKAEIEKLQKT